jgi:hypothetical protein
MARINYFPSSRALLVGLAGMGVSVVGLLIQWVAAPELFGGFPPGIVWIGAAAGIAWLDRGSPWSPAAVVALALWITIGGLAGGRLVENLTSGDAGLVAGNLVMLLGLLVAAVAGVLAVAHNRRHRVQRSPRPLGIENPRRLATLVTVVALVAVAVGDAAPEGLRWDGPGPVLFAVLAVLVALVPGRSMLLVGVLMCAAFVVGWIRSTEVAQTLGAPGDWFPFACAILQLLGLLAGIVAGIVAAWPRRRTVRGYARVS